MTRFAALAGRVRVLLERCRRTRAARALARYSAGRGPLLAGGIAYTGLFSVFAALTLGVSLLMVAIGHRPAMRRAVLETVDAMLPGMIDDGAGKGLVSIDQLTLDSAVNPGSVLATAVLLYSALSLMGALASGIRAMFGLAPPAGGPLRAQVRNLLGFAVITVSVLLTAAAFVLTTALAGADSLPSWLTGPGARALAVLVSFLIDAGVLALLIRVCGVRAPRGDLVQGAGLGALAFGVLRQMGTGAVGAAARGNPMLAPFTAMIVLILWLHLTCRVVLYACAWTANPPQPAPADGPGGDGEARQPNYASLSAPPGRAADCRAAAASVDP